MCMYVLLTYDAYASFACLEPREARRECGISCNWSDMVMSHQEVLGMEPWSSERAASSPNH